MFIFWDNSRTPKCPFEIIRPLLSKYHFELFRHKTDTNQNFALRLWPCQNHVTKPLQCNASSFLSQGRILIGDIPLRYKQQGNDEIEGHRDEVSAAACS